MVDVNEGRAKDAILSFKIEILTTLGGISSSHILNNLDSKVNEETEEKNRLKT